MKYSYVAVLAVSALAASCAVSADAPKSPADTQATYVNPALDNIEPDEKVVIDRFSSKVSYYDPASGRSRTNEEGSHYFAYLDQEVPHKYFSYGDSQKLDYKLFSLNMGRAELVTETTGQLMLPIGISRGRAIFVAQSFDSQGLPSASALYELDRSKQLNLVSQLPFVVVDAALEGDEIYATRYIEERDDFSLYTGSIDRPLELEPIAHSLENAEIDVLNQTVFIGHDFGDQYPKDLCELTCDSVGENLVVWLAVEDDELSVKSTHAESGTTRSITSGPILGFEVNGQTLEVYTSSGVENYPLGEIND